MALYTDLILSRSAFQDRVGGRLGARSRPGGHYAGNALKNVRNRIGGILRIPACVEGVPRIGRLSVVARSCFVRVVAVNALCVFVAVKGYSLATLWLGRIPCAVENVEVRVYTRDSGYRMLVGKSEERLDYFGIVCSCSVAGGEVRSARRSLKTGSFLSPPEKVGNTLPLVGCVAVQTLEGGNRVHPVFVKNSCIRVGVCSRGVSTATPVADYIPIMTGYTGSHDVFTEGSSRIYPEKLPVNGRIVFVGIVAGGALHILHPSVIVELYGGCGFGTSQLYVLGDGASGSAYGVSSRLVFDGNRMVGSEICPYVTLLGGGHGSIRVNTHHLYCLTDVEEVRAPHPVNRPYGNGSVMAGEAHARYNARLTLHEGKRLGRRIANPLYELAVVKGVICGGEEVVPERYTNLLVVGYMTENTDLCFRHSLYSSRTSNGEVVGGVGYVGGESRRRKDKRQNQHPHINHLLSTSAPPPLRCRSPQCRSGHH